MLLCEALIRCAPVCPPWARFHRCLLSPQLQTHTALLQARRVEKRLADKKMKMEMDESGEGRHGALFHAASAPPAAHTDSPRWLHFQQHHGAATCAHGHICVPAHS